jgi:Na+-transporting methylmalonyl-CoA/oxaloacetate decarboxylase gamma subunit
METDVEKAVFGVVFLVGFLLWLHWVTKGIGKTLKKDEKEPKSDENDIKYDG